MKPDNLNHIHDLPHNNCTTPDIARLSMFAVWRWYNGSVFEGCCWLSMCVDSGEIYIYLQNKHFRFLHQNRAQNIIQCHDNNIWKQMFIKKLSYSTETYLQYNIWRGGKVKKYMWALHHKLVLFLQSRNCFCYVPDN